MTHWSNLNQNKEKIEKKAQNLEVKLFRVRVFRNRIKTRGVSRFGLRGPVLTLDPILETSGPCNQKFVFGKLTSEVEDDLHNLIKFLFSRKNL